jgi:cysteine desulfurase
MLVNNEIGTVQDCVKIGKLISRINKGRVVSRRILFHIDACQAPNYLKVDVEELGCDLLTLNGSKIYGPKGSGVLFVREGVKIEPILYGGEQESGLVAGTLNVGAIVGFSKALELAFKGYVKESVRVSKLRDYFVSELLKIKATILNGDAKRRVANNVNVSFVGLEAQQIVLYLSQYGIMASAGSACSANKIGVSHVIEAMGVSSKRSMGAVRFTLGLGSSKNDLVEVVKKVKVVVKSLRAAF